MSILEEALDRQVLQYDGRSGQNRYLLEQVIGLLLGALLVLFLPASALAGEWSSLANRLVAEGFSETWVNGLFDRLDSKCDTSIMGKKMRTLYSKKFGTELVRKLQKRLYLLGYEPGKSDGKVGSRTKQAIMWFQNAHGLVVDGKPTWELLHIAIKEHRKALDNFKMPPPTSRPFVYETIMTPERLDEAKAFHDAHEPLLQRLERRYDVPREITVGILTVETRVGKYLGEKSAFLTLASMAMCGDFSRIESYFDDERLTKKELNWLKRRTARKAEWAYSECKALLTYARANRKDPLTIPGSFYGAIGICQFMPTKVLKYGVDGNGDGIMDVFLLEDALFSLGNYVRAHGWKGTMKSRSKQYRVIYNYNHSKKYANTVLAVANYLRATANKP